MLEVPDGEEPSRIADWVELELSVELPSLSRSKVAGLHDAIDLREIGSIAADA